MTRAIVYSVKATCFAVSITNLFGDPSNTVNVVHGYNSFFGGGFVTSY